MSKEDLEVEVPKSDLDFLKAHGFHLEPENRTKLELISKDVFTKTGSTINFTEPSERIETLIVFTSPVVGSYVMLRYYIQKNNMSTSLEFTCRFELGKLEEAFENLEQKVIDRLFFGERTETALKIAKMMSSAIEMNDESKMIGSKSCNIYHIQ